MTIRRYFESYAEDEGAADPALEERRELSLAYFVVFSVSP
jgi:hypothetical protein